jgi:hypothetical protein
MYMKARIKKNTLTGVNVVVGSEVGAADAHLSSQNTGQNDLIYIPVPWPPICALQRII